MTPERWRQVTEVFHAALARDVSARAGYLDRACAGDRPLREEVEAMLAAQAIPGDASVTAMPRFASGTMIGPYRIAELIGAGGMGEVYRATDANLGRQVAIKILPKAFAQDADRLARFEREAKTLASLNHTNVAQIYGLERSHGTTALVMEFVEGPTLAERIAQGAVPIDEARSIAEQIAEALEAAHEKGIIHRDLKPANVKVRPDGAVKVLDFGLAKALDAAAPSDVSHAPTITSPAMTGVGVILGTAAYMSPEQARAKPVDKRADIWAFGCVFYEMLTGRPAFTGETVTEVVAMILERDPDFTRLPTDISPRLVGLLRRCLEKDPRRRLRDIGEVRFQLEEPEAESEAIARTSAPAHGVLALGRRVLLLSLGTLLLGAGFTGGTIWFLRSAPSVDPEPVSRFTITLPPDQPLLSPVMIRNVVALSPQGTHLVYAANRRLYLRPIDQLSATPIQGTEVGGNVFDPFFSLDGQWIVFGQGGALKKVAISGGAPVKLIEVPGTMGMSWGTDDAIIYSLAGSGIWRVSGQGGTPERLVAMDDKKGELAYGPQLLPGARAVLFTLRAAGTGWNEAQIVVQSLDGGERKVVVRGGRDARYVETGHLVYARAGTLIAVPFDLDRLEVTGGPVPMVEGVRDAGSNPGATFFSLSGNGSLIYVPADAAEVALRTLVWVARSGAEQPVGAPPRPYDVPRLSPDGGRVVVKVEEAETGQIWVYDLARDTSTRLTFGDSDNSDPVWTPDGKRIAFGSNREKPTGVRLFWQPADGSGAEEVLTDAADTGSPGSWSPDGQLLAFHQNSSTMGRDIMVFRLSDRKAEPFLQTQFQEGAPRFSPDGRWLAYVSNESGRPEIYVQPYPGPGGKWQVSNDGGTEPVWNRNGRELFYRSGNRMMAVETTTQPSFSAGKPRQLFEAQYFLAPFPTLDSTYDVSPDGQRFLMIKETKQATAPSRINVVLNWREELKRLVPTN